MCIFKCRYKYVYLDTLPKGNFKNCLKQFFLSLGNLTSSDFTQYYTNIPKLIYNLKIKGTFEENDQLLRNVNNSVKTFFSQALPRGLPTNRNLTEGVITDAAKPHRARAQGVFLQPATP